jgi:hypothetical protein
MYNSFTLHSACFEAFNSLLGVGRMTERDLQLFEQEFALVEEADDHEI